VTIPVSGQTTPPGSSKTAIAVLYGIILALVAASVFLFIQVDRLRGDLASLRDSVQAEVTKVQEASSLLGSANQRNLDALREELENAKRNADAAVGQAKTEALRHAEQLTKRIEVEQKKQQQQVASELSAVKEAAGAANTKIADVSSEVGTVRSDVASTKAELQKTISDLKSVRGDLGVQSGLVATNATELAALRSLGDRNYFDFKLSKTKQPQRVGDVAIRLTKTDEKKNKFTVIVIADDKTVEKKDKNVNEPIQFYVAKARIPYEIVVNTVSKDQIAGYLATPKVQVAR
jgi:chromosome segregation ATPase